MKHTSTYLYDIDPLVFKNMKYEEALHFKIKAARKMMKKLAVKKDPADIHRYMAAENAIQFNERLLNEL